MKKYLNKIKIVEHCDSEVPILTVALFWSARQGDKGGGIGGARGVIAPPLFFRFLKKYLY